jgi:uncharacterized protein (DUF2141 family)
MTAVSSPAKKGKLSATFYGILGLLFFLVPMTDVFAQIIRIVPEGLHTAKGGKVFACLFNSSEGFPDQAEKAFRILTFQPGMAMEFPEIPFGRYALALLHDLDKDNKMTYSFLGLPKDGYASSPDGGPALSKPVFQKAAFEHRSQLTSLKIRFHYLP